MPDRDDEARRAGLIAYGLSTHGLIDDLGNATDRAYEIASADVVLPLDRLEAEAIADALEAYARVATVNGGGDFRELTRLAGLVRRYIGHT